MAETLRVWRLSPVAQTVDPAWQGRRIWTRVDVVAGTVGEAILAAVRHEQALTANTDQNSQDHQQGRSGFEDERLYRVDRLPEAAPAGALPGDVVFAE